MTSYEALNGKNYTVVLYLYDRNGNLTSTTTKEKQFPYYVNDNSLLTFDGICSVNLTLKGYTYHERPSDVGNRHYIEGYSSTFQYEITLANNQYEYILPTDTKFYHIYDYIYNDDSDTSSQDYEYWQDFIETDEAGIYEGYRSMTENLPSGRVFDQRIFTDFRFYIHLRRKGRTPTYLPVRTDGGIIARHAYTNIIFRDDYMG